MTTSASVEMREYAAAADALPDYPSSSQSGIVGDSAHQTSNSYHNSLEDNPNQAAGSYTNKWPDDAAPPGGWSREYASANDQSMNTADMVREWNRYLAVFNNRANDPRAKYVAEYIGWNGVGSAERLDFRNGMRTTADNSHQWHSHKGRHRRYYNSREANRAMLSIDRGETVQQYLSGGDVDQNELLAGTSLSVGTALKDIWGATQADRDLDDVDGIRSDIDRFGRVNPYKKLREQINADVAGQLASFTPTSAEVDPALLNQQVQQAVAAAFADPNVLANIAKAVADETYRRQKE